MALLNYVVAAWSGKRRGSPCESRTYARYEDSCCNLRVQLSALSRYGEGVGKVTIVVPKNPAEPEEFGEFLEHMGERLPIPLVVLRRENVGFASGSYFHAYRSDDAESTHFFFIEDDYVMVRSGWAHDLLTLWSDEHVYLMAHRDGPGSMEVEFGLTTREVLELLERRGQFFLERGAGRSVSEWVAMFKRAGSVMNLSRRWCTLYLKGSGDVQAFGEGRPVLFVPAELYDVRKRWK